MLGKTHLAVGTAVAMTVLQPDTIPKLILGLGASIIGAVISDIDVGSSQASREANKIIVISMLTVIAIMLMEYFGHIGIVNVIQNNSDWMRLLSGFAVFIVVCIFGKMQPHRSFMHSLLALVILSMLVAVILPVAAPYFALAFATHLITDVFNLKKVRLLYPLPGGVSFKMFHARGIANGILFVIGSVVTAVSVCMCVWNIMH